EAMIGEGAVLTDFEVPSLESLQALRCEITLEGRRHSRRRVKSTEKEVPLGKERPLSFGVAPVPRKPPAEVITRLPARPGHFRSSSPRSSHARRHRHRTQVIG